MRMKQHLRKALRRFGVDVRRYRGEPYGLLRQRFLDAYAVDLVLDVGANSGQYGRGLRASGYTGRLLSFEPVAEARRRLEETAKGDPLWEISPLALGSASGIASINVAGNGAASSSLLPMLPRHSAAAPEADYVGTEEVQVSRLDDVQFMLGPAQRIHLKLDVQGMEGNVLDGATDLLSRIVGIEMEISFVPLYEGGLGHREAFDRMAQEGYTLKQIFPGFSDRMTGSLLQADAIFYREDPRTRE